MRALFQADSLVHTDLYENILWFHVSVEDAISVHVVDGLAQLVHVQLDPLFRQIGLAVCRVTRE